ncbi:MAG: hypothetical protein PHP00_06965 [Thiotrichaceae bacterium]|nr:hypothetical protein [Thiotrichaceae bacterium]
MPTIGGASIEINSLPHKLGTLVDFLCSDCASYIAIAVDGDAIAGLR